MFGRIVRLRNRPGVETRTASPIRLRQFCSLNAAIGQNAALTGDAV